MTSTPSTHSEGEVFTSDSEKATQTLPSHNGISVDRHTRPNATSVRTSRSRSPYRAPRGEKRRRDDEHIEKPREPDRRSQKSRYESDRYLSDRSGGSRPYVDSDLRHVKRSHHTYGHAVDRLQPSKRPRTRSRTRSRSPFRHFPVETRSTRTDIVSQDRMGGFERSSHANKEGSRYPDEQSVSERSKVSGIALASEANAKISKRQSLQIGPMFALTQPADDSRVDALTENEREAAGPTASVNEDALIEERRKRREALKAKYRTQETPLLVQALRLGADAESSASSTAQTPQNGEQSNMAVFSGLKEQTSLTGSVEPTSPCTPDGNPHSPTEINFDHDDYLANSNSGSAAGDEDEPSAADYDPTVDMQEERARHEKRISKDDVSTSADGEEKVTEQDQAGPYAPIQVALQQHNAKPNKQKDAFDMFAEDDEDDMFAEAPPKLINPSALSEKKTAQALDVKMMDNWDDPEGYYMTIPGELFESRYHVLQNLGRGMFSSVVRATDTKADKLVAIKVVRSNDTMRKAGIKEMEILKDLAANDPEDKKHLIRLERSFEHKGHLCMVFENLSLNLREVLKKFGRDVGINLKAIRAYAQQLFLGLSLLRKCQYLHADLKPDNILVNEARNVLKICDLGSASSIDENITAPYLVSRFYRAPEIILGIPYDYGIDIWSVGCTLFELYTGKILFTGRNNNSMLRSIMECRGKFPHKVLRKGSLTYQYFDDLLNFQSSEEDKLTGRTVTKMIDIKAKPLRGLTERLVPKGKRMDEQERREVQLFADLLDRCLDLRGDKRITPSEALRHAFITRAKN